MMNVKVGKKAYLNACDISMALLGVREVQSSCNKHGKLLDTRRTAPCSSSHWADRIVGIFWTRPASSVPGATLCPEWKEGSVPRLSSVLYIWLHRSPPG